MESASYQPPLLAILGPTASGKTDLALTLARQYKGEILSADSRQIYIGMDIGTAKAETRPTKTAPLDRQEGLAIGGIPHFLIDILTPDQSYSVARFRSDAISIVEKIKARGALPIVVGGTGHYVRALTEPTHIPAVPPDPAFRAQAQTKTASELLEELRRLDPPRAATIDPHNRRRLIRALEIARAGARHPETPLRAAFTTFKVAIAPDREVLRRRIEERVETMLRAGLVDEVRALVARYGIDAPGLQTIGYREVFPLLQRQTSLEETRMAILRATWQYARRQLTWLRKEPNVVWTASPEEARYTLSTWIEKRGK